MSPEDIRIFREIIREEVRAALNGREAIHSPAPSGSSNASYELRAAAFRDALRRGSERLARKRGDRKAA